MKACRSPRRIFCSKRAKRIDFMKRLSVLGKIVVTLNIIVAFFLFLACFTPYIRVRSFPALSFLGLAVPVLVATNMFFALYWLVARKRLWSISFLVLLIGYFMLGNFINLPFGSNAVFSKDDLTLMSFNVRVFNKNKNIDSETVFEDIKSFVSEQKPDIICFQETGYLRRMEYIDYPYKYLKYINNQKKILLAIFSKYPIVGEGLINFPDTHNSAAYADIVYQKDTIRVYNLHLQSLGITPGKGIIKRSSTKELYEKLSTKFIKQEQQAMQIVEHSSNTDYKKIICGDFNNSQFSRTYKILSKNMVDTFKAKGSGYGRTLVFHGVPVRIDFILADEELEVTGHKNYDVQYSDHYPIMASFRLGIN